MANAVFAAVLLLGGVVAGYVSRYWGGWGIDQPYNPMLVMAPFLVIALIARAAIAARDTRRKQRERDGADG